MAHMIARNVNGKDMVYTAGELPWHSLGQNVSEAQTWEKAIELAQLNWEVLEAPLYTHWGNPAIPASFRTLKVEGYKSIIRKDTKQVLGIHGMGYRPFQNVEAFQWCNGLIGEGCPFEAAGGLGIGERIWCLARIPQADFAIGDDKHQMYLLVATSHDGSLSTTITCTDVRVVCNNTLTAALGMKNESKEGKLKIKHTKQAGEKLTRVQQMVRDTVITADTIKAKLIALSQKQVTRQSVESVLDRLFPASKTATRDTRRQNVMSAVLENFERNDGNAFPEQRGTAYALLNAITDYVDHDRATRKTDGQTEMVARAESSLFGSGSALKSNALAVIEQVVADQRVRLSGPQLAAIIADNPLADLSQYDLDDITDAM